MCSSDLTHPPSPPHHCTRPLALLLERAQVGPVHTAVDVQAREISHQILGQPGGWGGARVHVFIRVPRCVCVRCVWGVHGEGV